MPQPPLHGIFAAAVTPLQPNGSPDPDGLLLLLDFLARRGCHGALLLGTTGEGPSFSPAERQVIINSAVAIRRTHPEFRLLAGTGTPSLSETIELTRQAFEAGVDGVVVLPPYYYRKASEDGLFTWFSSVMTEAVPTNGALLGYHIPPVSGVAISQDLLSRLQAAFPGRYLGLKDSSGDPGHATRLGDQFGPSLGVFTGNDRLLTLALANHAAGCITAMANLHSPLLRQVWDAHQNGQIDAAGQAQLNANRDVFDRYSPAPALIKGLLARLHGLPRWTVRPPLLPLPEVDLETAEAELIAGGYDTCRE